jgi:hypothetical protein
MTFPDEALDPDEAQGAAAKAFRLARRWRGVGRVLHDFRKSVQFLVRPHRHRVYDDSLAALVTFRDTGPRDALASQWPRAIATGPPR